MGIFFLIIYELIVFLPEKLWWWCGLLGLLSFIFLFKGRQYLPKYQPPLVALGGFGLQVGLLTVLFFVDKLWLKQLLILLVISLTQSIYRLCKNRNLERALVVAGYVNLLSFFLFSTSLYFTHVFLGLPLWLLSVLLTLVIFYHLWQEGWLYQLKKRRYIIYLSILSLVLVEVSLTIAWLPFTALVKSLLLTSFFYSSVGLGKNFIVNQLDKKFAWRYVLAVISVWLITLLTARWA